jgi:hypothetical protein
MSGSDNGVGLDQEDPSSGARSSASVVLNIRLWNNLAACADGCSSQSKKNARCLDDTIGKSAMAARNQVLSPFEHPNDADDYQKDGKPVLGIAQAKANTNDCEGCKSLQIDGRARDGPEPNRHESEDGDGGNKQPCGPSEEDPVHHAGRCSRCGERVKASSGLEKMPE